MKTRSEIERIRALANGLSQLNGTAAGQSLAQLLENSLQDANTRAIDPATDEEKRAYWSGAAYALTELKSDLTDLTTGNWQNWTWVRKWKETEEDDPDEPKIGG